MVRRTTVSKYSGDELRTLLLTKRASDIARDWQVSRQWIHKLMKRFGIIYRESYTCNRCMHEWIGKASTQCPKCKSGDIGESQESTI